MIVARLSNRSLRTQIAIIFGMLVVGLAVVLSLGFGEMLKRRIQHDTGAALQVVAENAGSLLAQGLLERSRQAEVLASAEVIWSKGLSTVEAQNILARAQAIEPTSAWVGVADVQGTVRAATGSLLVGQSVADSPWFQAGLQKMHVGDVRPSRRLGSLLPPTASGAPYRFVDFSAPIRVGPTTIGVLAIRSSWEWAREAMDGLMPAGNRALELFIFDRAGKLLYAPRGESGVLPPDGQQLPPMARVNNNRDGDPVFTAVLPWQDGQRYLTAATQLQARNAASDLGWRIVAREPEKQAFSAADNAVRMALAIGLAAALLAAILAWLAARRLSEDLYALAGAASAVESGARGAHIPPTASNREVRQLSGALGRMTQRLLASHEAMEEQVRQRTLELEAANRALDLQARTDALTGLLNRRGFEAQMSFALALARRSGRPLSLIAVDVDHFKRVNDTHGHEAGDEVLRRLARTLQDWLRASDVVARLGGEEFVALLPDTDLAGAQSIAQALVAAVAAQQDPLVGAITVSAGVARLRGPQDTGADLLRRGDAALYAAKDQGRNRVCVEED